MGSEADITEEFDAAILEEPPEIVEQFLRDAVAMAEAGDPDLGDVDVAPGEIVGMIDGVEIRHLVDEADHVLPVVDEYGELIGKDSFPEVADFPSGRGDG